MAAQAVRQPPRQRGEGLHRGETLTAYLFIAPYLLIASIFTIGLLVYAFYISFSNMTSTLQRSVQIVGIQNYIEAFSNRDFRTSLINVFWYFLLVTSLQTVAAIMLAITLNQRLKGQRLFRTLFYAPSVTSTVVMSMIFLWLYLPSGFINYGLGLVGLPDNTAWLRNPNGLIQNFMSLFGVQVTNPFLRGPSIAWTAIMFMNVYSTAPSLMLLFLVALQDIPDSIYEAAAIDGATGMRQFFSVTLPLLRPSIVLVVVLGTIGTFQVFDQVSLMTKGGPLNTTLTPAYLIYTKTLGQATSADASLAAAMAFILAAIIFIITYLQRRYIEAGTERY